VTAIRKEKAKELLQNSSLSMKEICAQIGYADPNYFRRTFKKNVGVTPTEYKEGKTDER
jgi:two-component system response regulator YesN